jgi:hypothetical protein
VLPRRTRDEPYVSNIADGACAGRSKSAEFKTSSNFSFETLRHVGNIREFQLSQIIERPETSHPFDALKISGSSPLEPTNFLSKLLSFCWTDHARGTSWDIFLRRRS